MLSALNVAEWFLNENRIQMNFEDSEYITNLKLQKLLYYAQGFNLAKKDKALFQDDFLSWEHGPVIRNVYDKYKENGSEGIKYNEDFNIKINDDTKEILKEVYSKYGQFTAWKLRDMTHNESPWKDTGRNNVISKEKIKEYFRIIV